MADVQTEHGYLKLANELVEAFARAGFPGRHRQVLDAIIRLTYGYNKKRDRIAASQIADMTGISRGNVATILRDLNRWHVVESLDGGPGRVAKLGIQKDHERWERGPTAKAKQHDRSRERASQGTQDTCLVGDASTCIPGDAGSGPTCFAGDAGPDAQPASPAYKPASPTGAEPASPAKHTKYRKTSSKERAADGSPARRDSDPDSAREEPTRSPLLNLIAKLPGKPREKELWLADEVEVIEAEADVVTESKGCTRPAALRSLVVRYYRAYLRRPTNADGERKWQREARLEPARKKSRELQERLKQDPSWASMFAEGDEELRILQGARS